MIPIPYSTAPPRLKEFLERIPSQGIPTKFTVKELELRGFRSSNDRSIIRVLKALGFIDDGGTPSEIWRQFRDRNINQQLLGSVIQTTYSDLFNTYPDAQNRSDAELQNFMSTTTGAPAGTVQQMVKTFRVLCSIAVFDNDSLDASEIEPMTTSGTTTNIHQPRRTKHKETSPQLQLNLHLHIPDTEDADKIDQIFRSMARHLLGRRDEDENSDGE